MLNHTDFLFVDKRGGLFGPGLGLRSGGGGGGGGGFSGVSRTKSDGGVPHYKSSAGGGREEYSEPVYPEELADGDDVAPRTDIEHINLVSEDEDEVVVTGQSRVARNKGKSRASGRQAMRPIRLTRHEHKERVMLVNTDSSADKPKAEVDEEAPKTEEDEDEGLFVLQEGTVVKAETPAVEDDVDIMDLDGPFASQHQTSANLDTPSQPVQPQESADLEAPTHAPETALEQTSISRKSLVGKGKQPVLQTEEDRAEYARYLEDIEILSKELGAIRTVGTELDDGDVEMGEDGQPIVKEKAEEVDPKEGRIYLFQFPPILPKLANATQPVKSDPGDTEVELADIPTTDTIDLSAVTPEVKAEPTVEVDVDVQGAGGVDMAKDALVREPGFIGKMVTRKSGKVEFSWGGTSLELGRGAEFDFLTTGLVVQGLETAKKGIVTKEEEGRMSGTGMGRIMGKFVMTPDWQKLFD